MAYPPPTAENEWLRPHVHLLRHSFCRLTGRHLIDPALSDREAAEAIWLAPFVVVSHDTAADPIFTYGNETALGLFKLPWEAFTTLPSRLSAETPDQVERARLLAEVARQGFIENYQGIRIASRGQRFRIQQAVVWNLIDEAGSYRGQAATFGQWQDM